jgi:hypothetical protein
LSSSLCPVELWKVERWAVRPGLGGLCINAVRQRAEQKGRGWRRWIHPAQSGYTMPSRSHGLFFHLCSTGLPEPPKTVSPSTSGFGYRLVDL